MVCRSGLKSKFNVKSTLLGVRATKASGMGAGLTFGFVLYTVGLLSAAAFICEIADDPLVKARRDPEFFSILKAAR